MKHTVAFGVTVPAYNGRPPFHPGARYPELPFADVAPVPNWPYELLRELFVSLDLDRAQFGSPAWNPLGHLIQPGQTVLLKPNYVLSFNAGGDDLFAVVTHPSILRALIDYAYVALRGEGRIIVADVPQMDCDWEELMRHQRLDAIQEFYAQRFGFKIETYDLRNFAVIDYRKPALTDNRKKLPGDPAGSVVINLGRRSHFYGLPNENFYGADYNRQETIAHHHGDTHEYCVSKTILSADVFLSVPKMKTHKKVGVTLNFKGLVGINTNKNYLVHYRLGSPSSGGDQLPDQRPGADRGLVRIQRWAYDKLLARQSPRADALYRFARSIYRATVKPVMKISQDTLILDAGNWHGNDSAWRMTADLAKILYFADADGVMRDHPQRRMFSVVDGIMGGDGMGPLEPDAKPCGCLIAGQSPLAVDLVTARLMGFDPKKLRQFDIAFAKEWDLGLKDWSDLEVRVAGQAGPVPDFFAADAGRYFGFNPHPGWVGKVEI
jgi:uncharacterized protein (DUF362 family)